MSKTSGEAMRWGKKFQLRLSPVEARALTLLAKRAGTHKASYMRAHIRREAKKKGIPV